MHFRLISNERTIRPKLVAFLFTFSASFAVYLFTLSPTIGLEDSGELAGAVASFGIPHPSGYPLYVILGKLFTLIIPFGDLAWRINLFSAFCGSLTIGLFTLFLINILSSLFPRQWTSEALSSPDHLEPGRAWSPKDEEGRELSVASLAGASKHVWKDNAEYFTAIAVSLAFAFSPVFWSQAVITEVYTLNTTLFLLTLLALWRYATVRTPHSLYAFAFIYGLSLTNHTMLALMAPVYSLFLIFLEYGSFKSYKACILRYGVAFLLFACGLCVYFFILFRAQADPVFNWGHPDTWTRFWAHITRRTYMDVQLDFWNNIGQFRKLIYVHFFFRDLFAQLGITGALFSFIGFIALWFKRRSWLLTTLGILLCNSLVIILLRRLSYTYETETIYTVYYLPSFLVSFLWLGIGIETVLNVFMRLSRKQLIATLFAVLIAFLPVANLIASWHTNDRSALWIAYDWAAAVLESLPPDTVLLIHNEEPASDSQIFALAYVHLIERVRTDVAIVDFSYLSSRWYHPTGGDIDEINRMPLRLLRARLLNRVWKVAEEAGRPLYTLWPVGSGLNEDLTSAPNGLAYRVFPDVETAHRAVIPPASVSVRNEDEVAQVNQPYYLDFASDLSYTRAAYLLAQGHFKASESSGIRAFNLDQTPLGINAQDYMQWRERWLGEKSQTTNSKSHGSTGSP